MTANRDQAFEQRLQAREDDLLDELRNVPEMRLLSDDEVKKVRGDEGAAQKQIVDAARADLNAARANQSAARFNRFAHRAAEFAYRQAVRHYQEVTRRGSPEKAQAIYYTNDRLHQAMKRKAVQAGLELDLKPNCQLAPSTAAEVATLSKELRDMGFVTVPGVPFVRRNKCCGAVDTGNGFNTGKSVRSSNDKADDKMEEFRAWCDQHRLERLKGTVPTLTQMLQIEDEATRLLLVRELTRTNSPAATVELTMRALADLSPAVRRAALAGLEQRPSSEYVPILLRGLRYPWPRVADHAAVALRKLKPQEAVAPLVHLLDLPSPSTPILNANTQQYRVREVVRLNHLRNCLLCHAPSANKNDGLVRGLVPTPGQPLPHLYYESQVGDFVRADITFLRQDFSVNLPEINAAPWPNEQRFDFVTRLRTVPPDELAQIPALSANYPQRDAVLYALRGVTGKDGGDSSAIWRELLGLIVEKPKPEKKSPDLDKIVVSPSEVKRSR